MAANEAQLRAASASRKAHRAAVRAVVEQAVLTEGFLMLQLHVRGSPAFWEEQRTPTAASALAAFVAFAAVELAVDVVTHTRAGEEGDEAFATLQHDILHALSEPKLVEVRQKQSRILARVFYLLILSFQHTLRELCAGMRSKVSERRRRTTTGNARQRKRVVTN